MLAVIASVIIDLKDCSRSQAVTCAKQLSRKWCKIDT